MPAFLAASLGPTYFAAWASQGPSDAGKIRSVYALFTTTDKDTIGELLRELTLSKEGEEISLAIFVETRGSPPFPHVLLLHGLGIGPVPSIEESEAPLYAWALDNSSGQALLSVQVESAWFFPSKYRVMVNKVESVDAALQNTKPSDP